MRYLKSAAIWLPSVLFITLVIIGASFLYSNGLTLLALILVLWYFLGSLFTIIVFIQRRNETAKLSWLFAMNLIPLLGHLIFILFGQRYANRKENNDYKLNKYLKYEDTKTSIDDLTEDVKSLFEKQRHISARGIYPANIDLYRYGEQAYASMFEDMKNAKKFIHIQFYIIKPGEIYEKFKSILIKKAREGVQIRFIVDDFGRWALPRYELKFLQKEGIKIKIFGKVNFPFIGSENGYRTHRKMVIIDGNLVHTGGLNIADEYASINPKYGMWIDFQTRITGKAVRSYSLLFMQDWELVKGVSLTPSKYLLEDEGGRSKMIMTEDSPENREPILQDTIIQLILNAKKEIHLTTPYFIPTTSLMSALKTACLSGVKVNIYIPGKPDKQAVLIASRTYAGKLQKYGANIFETKDMLIHSKVALFDNSYAYFGTANLDVRSLYSQFELINIISGPDINQIVSLFEHYRKLSRVVEDGEFKPKGLKEKLLRIYVNLFSPIM